MSTITFRTISRTQLADLQTPISIYLRLRDQFAQTFLLESSDYQSRENSYSFIGALPLAEISIQQHQVCTEILDAAPHYQTLPPKTNASQLLEQFCAQFKFEGSEAFQRFNGLFGHTNFDAVQYFETVNLDPEKRQHELPDLRYTLYRFVLVLDHYSNQIHLLENIPAGEKSELHQLLQCLKKATPATYTFQLKGETTSNLSDEAFKDLVSKGKRHCALGDVFQIVFSRQFQQKFKGDEFSVYRCLRAINPSPYLFYVDYGSYKLFGSSPEAQLVIQENKAILTPIAGTYKRTGDPIADQQGAQDLLADPKENAEHVMLVDLARNDLNRHTDNVTVAAYKTVQYYSHVIHLVSKVEGIFRANTNVFQVFGDTFPAGTLSGAPKYKALELIAEYEQQSRGFYGGAIGFFNPTGQLNQAIMIRSFMSCNNCLYFQAGAGIVIDSNEERELQEVNNKLAALKKALYQAEALDPSLSILSVDPVKSSLAV